jgi:hypothetical protein
MMVNQVVVQKLSCRCDAIIIDSQVQLNAESQALEQQSPLPSEFIMTNSISINIRIQQDKMSTGKTSRDLAVEKTAEKIIVALELVNE